MPRDPDDSHAESSNSALRTKRTSACMHCRRQKLKCDAAPNRSCTRCRDDGVECVVRPRANAALLADDLRWQQSVESRLQSLTREIAAVKAQNADLVRQAANGGWTPSTSARALTTPAAPPPPLAAVHSRSHDSTISHANGSATGVSAALSGGESVQARVPLSPSVSLGEPHHLPQHLYGLRDILRPALRELQQPTPLDVNLDDATLLWEYFYDSLSIFHGFTASTELATPSPLLFSAVVTASAKRFTAGALRTPTERWEELFQRALVRLLYVTVPKTWDDVVGLGIARTWFWKADEITSGLIYGSYVETTTPNQNDFRDRRVWDFLEMTTVSHGILHLSTPVVPDRPPRGVPARPPSHLLLSALSELFDALGVVNRALTSARSLVMLALTGVGPPQPITYAEVAVLRQCRAELERWAPKWLYEIQSADPAKLPTGSGREFLHDLVQLYYQVALVVVDGYLHQSSTPDGARYESSARELLGLVVGRWADSLHLWPKLFLHSALIAALVLPPEDNLVRHAHDLFVALSHMLQTSGGKLLLRLVERLASSQGSSAAVPPLMPVFTPLPDLDLPAVMAYTGSDSFWADLSGMLGLEGVEGGAVHQPAQAVAWPRGLSDWNTGVKEDPRR